MTRAPHASNDRPLAPWRNALHEFIYEADTPAGKAFDIALIWCIVISVVAVLLESVDSIQMRFGTALLALEWAFTALFTIEYVLRILTIRRPLKYVFSFFGVIDLLAILPTYLTLINLGNHSLLVVRGLRLLRVFRVLKLAHFLGEAHMLTEAIKASRFKITVFLVAVLNIVLIMGAVMYLIEGEEAGFTSIPKAMYWAVVTLTTVGYGDITPLTIPGQMLAAIVMVTGYAIIAVPTGIVTVELAEAARKRKVSTQACRACSAEGHDSDAKFCKYCGEKI